MAMTSPDGNGISASGGAAPPIKPKLCRLNGCGVHFPSLRPTVERVDPVFSAGLLAHGQCPRSPSRCRFAAFSDVVDRVRSAYSCGGSSGLGDLAPYRIPVSPLARHRKTEPREHDASHRASADRIANCWGMPGGGRRNPARRAVDNATLASLSVSSISFTERGTWCGT